MERSVVFAELDREIDESRPEFQIAQKATGVVDTIGHGSFEHDVDAAKAGTRSQRGKLFPGEFAADGDGIEREVHLLVCFRSGVWGGLGHGFAAVAGVAGKLGFAREEFAVVFTDHGDHGAGDILLGIGVTGEITLYVAAGAFHAQGGYERTHHGTNFVIRQDLEVFVRLGRALLFSSGWLGEKRDGDQNG